MLKLIVLLLFLGCSSESSEESTVSSKSVNSGDEELVSYDHSDEEQPNCHEEYADSICEAHMKASQTSGYCIGMEPETRDHYNSAQANPRQQKLKNFPVQKTDSFHNIMPKRETIQAIKDFDKNCNVEKIVSAYEEHLRVNESQDDASALGLH